MKRWSRQALGVPFRSQCSISEFRIHAGHRLPPHAMSTASFKLWHRSCVCLSSPSPALSSRASGQHPAGTQSTWTEGNTA